MAGCSSNEPALSLAFAAKAFSRSIAAQIPIQRPRFRALRAQANPSFTAPADFMHSATFIGAAGLLRQRAYLPELRGVEQLHRPAKPPFDRRFLVNFFSRSPWTVP